MRLTEQQRRDRAFNGAVARAAAELGLTNDEKRAKLLDIPRETFSYYRRKSYASPGLSLFCKMANRFKLTDEEILRIVRGRE